MLDLKKIRECDYFLVLKLIEETILPALLRIQHAM